MSAGRTDPVQTPGPTPDEVRNAMFSQSQLAWRGYSEDEVREFLAKVADAMAAATKERAALRAEIDRLRNFYREHGTDVDRVNGASRRRDPEPGSLMGRMGAYTEVQIARARQFATLVDGRDEKEADEVFHHSKVQAALATEQAIRALVEGENGRSPAALAEMRRASAWLRAFAYALCAQIEVANDVFDWRFPVSGRHRPDG
jgi:DivIVA domain-containing protein